MAITKVPNGPLIKKKGPFKGSTLKAGGKVIKKAVNGTTTTQTTTPPAKKSWNQMSPTERKAAQAEVKTKRGREGFSKYMDSITTSNFQRNADIRGLTVDQLRKDNKKPDVPLEGLRCMGKETTGCSGSEGANKRRIKREANRKNGGPVKKAKTGAMIKRADGSFSKRGLWDNIRANKGSGKKPTKQMLVQEKKIKAKAKK